MAFPQLQFDAGVADQLIAWIAKHPHEGIIDVEDQSFVQRRQADRHRACLENGIEALRHLPLGNSAASRLQRLLHREAKSRQSIRAQVIARAESHAFQCCTFIRPLGNVNKRNVEVAFLQEKQGTRYELAIRQDKIDEWINIGSEFRFCTDKSAVYFESGTRQFAQDGCSNGCLRIQVQHEDL